MFCPQCGTQMPDESRYCAKCGNRITDSKGGSATVKPQKKRKLSFKKAFLAIIVCLALGIVLPWAYQTFIKEPDSYDMDYTSESYSGDYSQEYSGSAESSGSSQTSSFPALPNPFIALDDAEVSLEEDAKVDLGDVTYTFDEYTFEFTPPSNLADNEALLTYKMLLQQDGYDLIPDFSEGFFSQYAIVLDDEYLAGVLRTHQGLWIIYVDESVGIDIDPGSSGKGGYQNESYDLSSSGGTYQNKSYFDGSYYVGGSPEYADGQRCKVCDGSGKCNGCHGDGLFNNPYLGGGDTSECNLCDDGRCDVCGGDGYYP